MNFFHEFGRELRIAALVAVAAAAMAAARAARAQTLTGALLEITTPDFTSSGISTATGGSIILTQSVGVGAITTMGGGGLGLTPGGVGIPPLSTSDFSFVHAFPTPFMPSLGHDRITFRGLPPKVTIKIYTITGQLVQTLTKNDPLTADLVWLPVTNASGRNLASGVYFYQVTGDTGRASGKIMVIR
ncbi:MAG: T9SS type A sorting domain-containing protein [Elusimicrobia bacterium]|nr:T9SS type A sorting domain-containing protein [Elusimicrobiota bacterium]MDE2512266.1 T9SS type A sorting domain-containing protein [Elusimicrobiota bacterium]